MRKLHPALKIILFVPMFLIVFFINSNILHILIGRLQLQPSLLTDLISELMLLFTVVIAIVISARLLGSISLSECGLKMNKTSGKELLIGLAIGTLIMSILLLILLLFGWMQVKGFAWNERDWGLILKDLSLVAGYMIIVAVAEELFFRGVLLQMMEKFLDIKVAVVVSSFLFALIHLLNPGIAGIDLIFITVSHTLAAVLIAMSFLWSHNLWMPIGIHFAWNLMEYYILGLTEISSNEAVFLITKITGPKLWAGIPGTVFGPESSITGIIVLIAFIVVFSKLNKRQKAKG